MKHEELPQMEGPGVSPKRIKALDDKITAYLEVRDQRIELTPREVELKQAVVTLMHANEAVIGKDEKGVIRYPVEGRGTLVLKPTKEKLSLQKEKKDDEEVELEPEVLRITTLEQGDSGCARMPTITQP